MLINYWRPYRRKQRHYVYISFRFFFYWPTPVYLYTFVIICIQLYYQYQSWELGMFSLEIKELSYHWSPNNNLAFNFKDNRAVIKVLVIFVAFAFMIYFVKAFYLSFQGVFKEFDKDSSGRLSSYELRSALHASGKFIKRDFIFTKFNNASDQKLMIYIDLFQGINCGIGIMLK